MKNHQGSVLGLATFGGSVVKTYKYDAFGNIKQETGPTINRGFTYTSRERHSRSGLYYYRARWYSPVLGRFLSPDPIGEAGGVNLYAYVLNDPVNLIDPLGLCEENLWDDFRDWLMNDFVVPGPYGSSDPNDWGNWVSLPYEAGKFGKGWEYAEWGAIGTATAATAAAAGLMGAEVAGYQTTIALHGAHHTFDSLGELSHVQLNWWRTGVKGSGGAFRMPLPWR